jgi:hypothetical protein
MLLPKVDLGLVRALLPRLNYIQIFLWVGGMVVGLVSRRRQEGLVMEEG